MPSLAEEQPSATHFLIFAASDGTKDPVCRYVAHLEAADGRPELKIEVTVRHPGGALLEATIRAAGCVPEDSHLHVIGKIDYVLTELNKNMAERIRSGYKNSTRKPLQDADLYQKLDELVRDRRVTEKWIFNNTLAEVEVPLPSEEKKKR